MEKFAREDCVRFLFLSPDLNASVDAEIPWPPVQRENIRRMVHAMELSVIGEKLSSVFDPDFEQARQEFHALLNALETQDVVREG